VSLRKVREGWDPLLRLVASIRRGLLSPKEALDRLGCAASGDPARDAADALGRVLRTNFLCDFLTQPDFRRELRTLLNRGESVHQLQRAVYHGRLDPQRGRRAQTRKVVPANRRGRNPRTSVSR
jgi:TnpA family transposase